MKHALKNKLLSDSGVKKFEKEHDAVFVGEFALQKHSVSTCALFYSENPTNDYSHYFIIYEHAFYPKFYISNGDDLAGRERTGIITPCGDFIYSRGRHDYIEHDGCMIDGGDSYGRYAGLGEAINFKIIKDKMVKV